MAKILVVDDQPNMRTTLAMLLRGAGHEVEQAPDADVATARLRTRVFDLVLTDLRLGERDGLDVLRATRALRPEAAVLLMTAFGTIDTAVEAMKIGAFDYLQKPVRPPALIEKVEAALAYAAGGARRQDAAPVAAPDAAEPAVPSSRGPAFRLVGGSAAMRDVLDRVARIAPTEATVLITGESGTGKELVARAVHAGSRRADRPFVTVNCAAINETLLESELFGHVRGAFTGAITARKGLFEEANGGTFFFDEIAETPPTVQAKLLRAIQEGEIRRLGENRPVRVDVRIIAATNQDLPEAIAERRFRKDLYYRLNVARFSLPPLRERPEDILPLAEFFLDRFRRKLGRDLRLGPGVAVFLRGYDFPGNVRELENVIEQAVALSRSDELRLEDVRPSEELVEARRDAHPADRAGAPLQDVVDEVERAHIQRTLEQVDGSRERAAALLGLSPTTLWRKMKRLNVPSR